MAFSRLIFGPSFIHPLQSSCSSFPQKISPNSSRKDTCQASSLSSSMKAEMSFTRANAAGNRNIHWATKVATQQVLPSPITRQGLNAVDLLSTFTIKTENWRLNPLQVQGLIERVIIDCRFFTFLAIAGSLIGSILCFVEGSVKVMQSYLHYLALNKLHHGNVVQLLIEAVETFFMGTSMLTFSMGLYMMFVRPKVMLHEFDQFGFIYFKVIPSWLKMESVWEAKTRLGHCVIMILQVEMSKMLKGVPLVTGLDLASFAGAVLFSSASIFCLSKLSSSEIQNG